MAAVLIIIDVQRGFIGEATAHIPARIEALQTDYASAIATRFFNPEGSAHRRLIGWQRFAPGSADTELAFAPKPGTRIVEKTGYSALTPELRALLGGAREIHLCGIATDNCVLATAVDAFDSGLTPVVPASACASHAGAEFHDWGLKILRRLIGPDQIR